MQHTGIRLPKLPWKNCLLLFRIEMNRAANKVKTTKMKTSQKHLTALLLILFIAACSNSSEDNRKAENTSSVQSAPAQDEAYTPSKNTVSGNLTMSNNGANETKQPTSSSAAVETGKDSARKFIRTAELKFRVKDVVTTTYSIEDITASMGGFVSITTLNSNIDSKTTTVISRDSSLETTWYTVTNSMVIRVPNTALDSTLKAIAPLIDFMDFRIVKADDVALQILSNQLAQRRAAKHEERVANAIDNRGKKLTETVNAEELLLRQQEEADNARIANYSLMDQVKFSTINISMYQKQTAKRELVYNEKNIEAYQPGLGSRLLDALHRGWEMISALLVFLTGLWGFFLFGAILYILYRRFGHHFRGK